jgi:hypothetical protein
MDAQQAAALTSKLAGHRASKDVVFQLRGVVRQVLEARLPDDAAAAVALDENDEPVIVAVSQRRAIRLKALGDSSDDFHIAGELLRFDHPGLKVSVDHVTVRGNFSGGLFIRRAWLYELGDGRTLRIAIDEESGPPGSPDEALEQALAAAAGWPAPPPTPAPAT